MVSVKWDVCCLPRRGARRERWNSSFAQDACYYKLKQTLQFSFLRKSWIFTPLLIFHFYLPSFKPFKCPLCPRPDRDKVALIRLYVLGHQELYELIKIIFPRSFYVQIYIYGCMLFWKLSSEGCEDYCYLLTEKYFFALSNYFYWEDNFISKS